MQSHPDIFPVLIHTEYSLTNDTIVATVTDNAANFMKAFEEYNISVVNQDPDEVDDDTGLSFIIIEPDNEDVTQGAIILPYHLRCVTHTLSLVYYDAKKALKNNLSLNRLNHASMATFSLWTA